MSEKLPKSAIPEVSVEVSELGYTVRGIVKLDFKAEAIAPAFTEERLEEIRVDMQRAWEEKILDIAAKILHKWGEGVIPFLQRIERAKEQSE